MLNLVVGIIVALGITLVVRTKRIFNKCCKLAEEIVGEEL